MLWTTAVEMLQALIFSLAHVFNGSLGWAVVTLSLALRVLLLPLTLRLAQRAFENQRRLIDLRPQIERLQRRHANDPRAQMRALAELYERNGVRLLDPAVVLGGLAQAPIYAAMFAALRKGIGDGVRFFWVRDLAAPSVVLSLAVGALTVAGMAMAPTGDPARRVALLPLLIMGAMTVWFLSSTSALFALSAASTSVVNVVQSALMRRLAAGRNVTRPV